MLQNLFLVALGSAFGGMARYGIGLGILKLWKGTFPLATCLINVLGSLLIGILAAWVLREDAVASANPPPRAVVVPLLMVGLCGGFTTFSTFSLETITLLKNGEAITAMTYTAASVGACLLATAAGYFVTSRFIT